MLKEAHEYILNLESKKDCMDIGYTIKKGMMKNYHVADIVCLNHELLNSEVTELIVNAIRKISVLPAKKLIIAAVEFSPFLAKYCVQTAVHPRKTFFILQ